MNNKIQKSNIKYLETLDWRPQHMKSKWKRKRKRNLKYKLKLIAPCRGIGGRGRVCVWGEGGTETGAENQLRFDKPTANNQQLEKKQQRVQQFKTLIGLLSCPPTDS